MKASTVFTDLGERCTETGGIDYIEEAECRGNILRCKAPYIITQNNRECRIGEFQEELSSLCCGRIEANREFVGEVLDCKQLRSGTPFLKEGQ
jgi:hypothetical protein